MNSAAKERRGGSAGMCNVTLYIYAFDATSAAEASSNAETRTRII